MKIEFEVDDTVVRLLQAAGTTNALEPEQYDHVIDAAFEAILAKRPLRVGDRVRLEGRVGSGTIRYVYKGGARAVVRTDHDGEDYTYWTQQMERLSE